MSNLQSYLGKEKLHTILGVDQATRVSGWSLILDGEIADYGTWKTPSKLKGLDAALWQTAAIEEALLHKGIQTLAIEDLFIGSHTGAKVIFTLGALRGMIVKAADIQSVHLELVTSQEVCAHCGISPYSNRKAKKRVSRQTAAIDLWQDRTRWTEIPEDAADAIAIGMIAYKRLKLEAMAE